MMRAQAKSATTVVCTHMLHIHICMYTNMHIQHTEDARHKLEQTYIYIYVHTFVRTLKYTYNTLMMRAQVKLSHDSGTHPHTYVNIRIYICTHSYIDIPHIDDASAGKASHASGTHEHIYVYMYTYFRPLTCTHSTHDASVFEASHGSGTHTHTHTNI